MEAEAFERAAIDWKGGVDLPTARDWPARLHTYLLPLLADTPVDQVGTAAVDDILRPLAMAGKHPTARAVGTHIAAVLRWAALREHPQRPPTTSHRHRLPVDRGHARWATASPQATITPLWASRGSARGQ